MFLLMLSFQSLVGNGEGRDLYYKAQSIEAGWCGNPVLPEWLWLSHSELCLLISFVKSGYRTEASKFRLAPRLVKEDMI